MWVYLGGRTVRLMSMKALVIALATLGLAVLAGCGSPNATPAPIPAPTVTTTTYIAAPKVADRAQMVAVLDLCTDLYAGTFGAGPKITRCLQKHMPGYHCELRGQWVCKVD